MKLRWFTSLLLVLAHAAIVMAAPPIDLEVATESGVQITAPREWLQLLTTIGIENVRIRGEEAGDEPKIDNRGDARRPRYHVLAMLSADEKLKLPGASFGRADRARLKDYFERLSADGAEAMTAPRGPYGLTEKEMAAVLADFTQPIDFETKGLTTTKLFDQLKNKCKLQITMDKFTANKSIDTRPVVDELKGISVGTGFAIALRANRMLLMPEKQRGKDVAIRVIPADDEALTRSSVGKVEEKNPVCWPIGWEAEEAPVRLAPSLFEKKNAEIAGFTLEETLAAIGTRIKLPMFVDHAKVATMKTDPMTVKVTFPRANTYYKRVIDRVLAQAHLGDDIRVDEAGKPFLWISR